MGLKKAGALFCACRNSTVFLPHSPSAVADATAQIRNGILQGSVVAPGNNNMQR
jgi:hypothetical protein